MEAGAQSPLLSVRYLSVDFTQAGEVTHAVLGVSFDIGERFGAVAPIAKIVPRGDTTVLDAYLDPVLRTYVEILGRSLVGSDVRAMTSSGAAQSSSISPCRSRNGWHCRRRAART